MHRIGLALNLQLDELPVVNITRDGQVVQAHLAVYDENYQLVTCSAGGVSDFGLSDGAPLYSVSVRRHHRYTISAALDSGPLGKLQTTALYMLPARTTRNQGYCPPLPCGP